MTDADEEIAALREPLVAWYRANRRPLPWRSSSDPYAIWVSEVMAQQTRIEVVVPRWERWLHRFPTVDALAGASLDDVLEEWAGLGYYARARNLHAAAREVAASYGGRVPDEPEAVRALPGVGRYTAGAILSFAFGRRAPILDGNVTRLLARLFRVDGDAKRGATRETLWSLAGRFVADGEPGEVNQALMELGALVCTPRNPACPECPLARSCAARRAGDPTRYPAPSRRAKVTAVEQVAVALRRRGKVLLARRPPRGLWGGLLELPTGEPRAGEALDEAARRVAGERTGLVPVAARPSLRFTHVLSHRRVTFHGFVADAPAGRVRLAGYDAHRWARPDEAAALGVSRATARLMAAVANSH